MAGPRPLVKWVGDPLAEKRAKLNTHSRGDKVLIAGYCVICDGSFIYASRWRRTCSDECAERLEENGRRAARARRRARLRDAFVSSVSPIEIFKRDHYWCYLCNRRTSDDAKVPDPLAPTIDHVIPLAKGGAHEPGNCRTACFECNVRKGDRDVNEMPTGEYQLAG
ncbi:HNH endonuclease [Mycolicibacterium sphagni]